MYCAFRGILIVYVKGVRIDIIRMRDVAPTYKAEQCGATGRYSVIWLVRRALAYIIDFAYPGAQRSNESYYRP